MLIFFSTFIDSYTHTRTQIFVGYNSVAKKKKRMSFNKNAFYIRSIHLALRFQVFPQNTKIYQGS